MATLIRGFQIAPSAINASRLATDAVETAKIKDLNVTAAKLAADAVTTIKILDANVTTAKLADNAVTSDKIAADAVTTAKILDANVTTAKLADSAVTGAKIAADAIDGSKIADAAIGSEHFSAGAVNTAAIGDGQVTEAKLASAVQDKLNATASKIVAVTTPTPSDVYDAGSVWIDTVGEEAYFSLGGGNWVKGTLTADELQDLAFTSKSSLQADFATNLTLAGISQVTGLQTALDGKVSLTGAQSIAGIKTFSDAPVFSAGFTLGSATIDGIRTSVRAAASAEDSKLATEKAVADALKVLSDGATLPENTSVDGDGTTVSFAYAAAGGTTVGEPLVFRNGQLLKAGDDYTDNGTDATFATAPEVGEVISTLRFYKLGN